MVLAHELLPTTSCAACRRRRCASSRSGCGDQGGVTPALVAAGYDVLAIDPRAPEGPNYRRITLEELEPEPFDAVVAGRVLHHVTPLAPALAKLAGLAPLLLADEFAWDRIDEAVQQWYERLYTGAVRRRSASNGAARPGRVALPSRRSPLLGDTARRARRGLRDRRGGVAALPVPLARGRDRAARACRDRRWRVARDWISLHRSRATSVTSGSRAARRHRGDPRTA